MKQTLTTVSRMGKMVLAILACIAITSSVFAQGPRTISYQGMLMDGSTPASGSVNLTIHYYYAGTSSSLFSESFYNVPVTGGVFNIELGSTINGVPTNIDWSQPMEIGVSVNGANEMVPHAKLTAMPYALTAYTLNGIPASFTPVNNTIFPIPLDDNGKIRSTILPTLTLNGVAPLNNNFQIAAGPNVTLSQDLATHTLTIGSNASPIHSVVAGAGLTGGGSSGDVYLAIEPGSISAGMLAPGVIAGENIRDIAGIGLHQRTGGFLDVVYDTGNFFIDQNTISLRQDVPVIGTTGNLSGNVNLGNTSASYENTFGTGGYETAVTNSIGGTADGSVTYLNGQVNMTNNASVNGSLTTFGPATLALNGGNVGVGTSDPQVQLDVQGDISDPVSGRILNMTGPSALSIISGYDMPSALVMSDNSNTGVISTSSQGLQFFVGVPENDPVLMTMTWQNDILFTANNIRFAGSRLQDIGMPQGQNDAATKDYVDGKSVLGHDLTGTTGSATVTGIQGIPVSGATPTNGQVLRYNSSAQQWQPQSTSIPTSGKAQIQNSDGYVNNFSATINNSAVTPTSVIICSIQTDNHSVTGEHYLLYITSQSTGSFTVSLHDASSTMSHNEGVTVNYVVLN